METVDVGARARASLLMSSVKFLASAVLFILRNAEFHASMSEINHHTREMQRIVEKDLF